MPYEVAYNQMNWQHWRWLQILWVIIIFWNVQKMQLNEQHNARHDFWQQCLGLRIEVILQQQVHFRPVNIGKIKKYSLELSHRGRLICLLFLKLRKNRSTDFKFWHKFLLKSNTEIQKERTLAAILTDLEPLIFHN